MGRRLTVYTDPLWPDNTFLLGYKGSQFDDDDPRPQPKTERKLKLKAIWHPDEGDDMRSLYTLMFDSHGLDYLMAVNGLSVGLNMPAALKSRGSGDDETTHSLPPYRKRKAFLVDEYPACPADWLRSSGRIKSFFVPIVEGAGLWLDFNSNNSHVNHTAIVVSAQGVNTVTGLPCKDPQLEQYRDACPKHKEAFGPDRLCKKCGFKWPKQNYLASTGTPHGMLWLDGFRAEDGTIRQYVFTAQKERGVANAIIGEDRVHALGISFFLSKEPRPQQQFTSRRLCFAGGDDEIGSLDYTACASGPSGSKGMVTYSASIESFSGNAEAFMARDSSRGLMGSPLRHRASPVVTKKLEVAAGAKVDQRIYDDPNGLDFWQTEPEGLVVVNYCSEAEAKAIIDGGRIDLSGSKEGFLAGIPVGNS